MFRKMAISLVSATLVFTPITTTAAHADEDVAKVLGGVAALVILNKVINDRQDRREARAQVNRIPQAPVYRAPNGQRTISRSLNRNARVAPQRCLRQQWTHRGNRNVYGARCMYRHTTVDLPQNCLQRVQTTNGPQRFFSPRCLRRNGWRA